MLTSYVPALRQVAAPASPALTRPLLARLAGLLYLVLAVCGGFSELVVRSAISVADDPAATADHIRASADQFRLAFVTDLVIFFGLWLLPLGYLVYVSGYFPRALGVLLVIGCFSYLANLVAVYASPTFESDLSSVLVIPAAIAEISFLLWLLVKGARA